MFGYRLVSGSVPASQTSLNLDAAQRMEYNCVPVKRFDTRVRRVLTTVFILTSLNKVRPGAGLLVVPLCRPITQNVTPCVITQCGSSWRLFSPFSATRVQRVCVFELLAIQIQRTLCTGTTLYRLIALNSLFLSFKLLCTINMQVNQLSWV